MKATAILTAIVLALLPATGQTGMSRLQRLDTAQTGRAWDAVGRIDIDGAGFCTGTLIAPDLVLTAAHCLFDKSTGQRFDPARIEFLAGWRNGRASAYRAVRRAVTHPDYLFDRAVTSERVRNDLALLELQRPIRNTTVIPFAIAKRPGTGAQVGVVSYAKDRAEAPSLQRSCDVMGRQQGVIVMSCDVDFGSSGAPVFSFDSGPPQIVSVISAKAELDGTRVALGSAVDGQIALLRAELAAGKGFSQPPPPSRKRVAAGARRDNIGARFIRPEGG